MRHFLFLLLTVILIGCSKDAENIKNDFTIAGKWNIVDYEEINGVVHDRAYIITVYYENGLEFTLENKFYPRYDNLINDSIHWKSNYERGGDYLIIDKNIKLSAENSSFIYSLSIIDNNKIQLFNEDTEKNTWVGTWTLVRDL